MGRYYTYKITFPGFPWFYYGVHKDNGKPYFGSPKTHKWIWDYYECEVQILEWFDTMEEAHALEQRLIKTFLNHPDCLNERCGGNYSEAHQKRAGLLCKEKSKGIFGLTLEEKVLNSRKGGSEAMKSILEKDPTFQSRMAQRAGTIAVKTGQLASIQTKENQDLGRKTCKRLGIGVFDLANRTKGGKKTSSIRHQCPACGKISTPGGIGRHLKSSSNSCSGAAIALT